MGCDSGMGRSWLSPPHVHDHCQDGLNMLRHSRSHLACFSGLANGSHKTLCDAKFLAKCGFCRVAGRPWCKAIELQPAWCDGSQDLKQCQAAA